MKPVTIKYLLGIDGGGTKTEFLLTDLNHNEIRRAVLGASNPIAVGIENTIQILEKGIENVCYGIEPKEISVFTGIAGSMSDDIKSAVHSFLSDFGFGASDNGSDTDNAIETALGKSEGIVVITGTGISAFSQTGNNRYRVGGWGYMIDKGGSGFNYGADALDTAFRHIDLRGGSELICKLIEERLGKPLTDSVADIYRGGAAKIASFAPVVFEAYKKGDEQAQRIIERNTKETADIIRAGSKHLTTDSILVVICGGLCRYRDILEPFTAEHLGSEFQIFYCDKPMVYGAVSLAQRGAKNA